MGCAAWIFVCAGLPTGYIVMIRGGGRSNAAAFGGSTPSAATWWAGAQTAKEERREGENGSLKRTGEARSRCTTSMVGAGAGGHLAHDPGRIGGKTGGGGSRSSRLLSLMRTHHQRHQHRMSYGCCKRRCAIRSGERNPQRKSCRWHGKRSRESISFVSSVTNMQPDRQWSQIYTRALFSMRRARIQRHGGRHF